jgi:simple sugar transport system permease protein
MLDRLVSFLLSTLSSSAPLALAALGGLATQASGSLAISLEGSMLVGAFAAAGLGQASGSLCLGMLAGTVAGLLLSCLVAASSLCFGADVFVAGLAANILAPGLVSVISQAGYGTKGVLAAEAIRAGPVEIIVILTFVSAVLVILLSQSVFGLRLRAAGEGADVGKAAGIDSGAYRFAAHLIAGGASGLSGAALAAGIGAFVPGMSTGRGWIALVAVFLGAQRPSGVVLASVLFGLLFALSNLAQAFSSNVLVASAELLQALPYIATAFALILWKSAERGKTGRL